MRGAVESCAAVLAENPQHPRLVSRPVKVRVNGEVKTVKAENFPSAVLPPRPRFAGSSIAW